MSLSTQIVLSMVNEGIRCNLGMTQKETVAYTTGDMNVLNNTLVVYNSNEVEGEFFQEQSLVSEKLNGVKVEE